MDFIKKNYEKVLLGVVLLGLAVGAVFLAMKIPSERDKLQSMSDEIIKRAAKPLPELDLTKPKALMERATVVNCLDLVSSNKVFNPLQWRRNADNSLIKILLGTEVGPAAVTVTKITPLNTTITYFGPITNASGTSYEISVEKEAAPKAAQRTPKRTYASLHNKTDTFVIREIKGPVDNPTGFILELIDTGEMVTLEKNKPYKRVDGYTADFRYPPDNKAWTGKRVNDGQTGTTPIVIAGESYIVVAISKNELVLSAKSNNKRTPRPYVPAP